MGRKGRPSLPEDEREKRRKESIARAREARKLVEADRIRSGLCKMCGEPQAATSKRLCQTHLEAHRSYLRSQSRSQFSVLKMNARRRHVDVCFTEAAFNTWALSQPQECHYCGVKFSKLHAATVDRKDNGQGYDPENACLACHRCNTLKSGFFRYNEWKEIADRYIKPRLDEFHAVCE